MNMSLPSAKRITNRILVIDDNPAIHEDFRKVLSPVNSVLAGELEDEEAAIFGEAPASRESIFQIDSAFQGEEGLEKVRAAVADGDPYAVAFVDVRMPPGWDGIETITRIWAEFGDLQIVICTAYSDYSWDEISKAIGNTDQLLILKKPFDNVEVLQMAHALSKKWQLTQMASRQMEELDALVSLRTAELREANARLIGEVAERVAAEEALRRSEERFSKAFHGSPVPMVIQRPDGSDCLDANASFLALVDASRDAVLAGKVQWWNDPTMASILRDALAGRRLVRGLAASVRTASDDVREVLVSAENLALAEASYHLFILQDITERVRLENELRHAQKMEAVGRLAAGVAHDFNNMLTVILGYSSMMQSGTPQLDGKLASYLRQVQQAAERATALTRQLLAYSRKQMIQRRSLDLNEIVRQTATMLRRIIGEHISIDTQFASGLPLVYADASSVDQVIMNLALNARDAMPNGGRLTLSTAEIVIDEAYRARSSEAQLGSHVCLTVKDDGHGMDAATMSRIFEPFFTTKEPGKGTGMGMATVYGVLKQHNGWIEVESALGRGATIRAFLPLSDGVIEEVPIETVTEPASGPGAESGESAPHRDATILLAEDEEMLRDFVSTALSSCGYQVLSAANGQEALDLWAERRQEIDLLLTDVVMPESISGRELAQKLMVDKPDLKVIFTSGYSAELIGPEFERDKEHGFLAKPYLTDDLVKFVNAELAGTR
jgi:two-component system, cell cycle sensor histidine kinase and response regulator CckA